MFELRLTSFNGPLDLLLRLVEEARLDITAVSLVQVTDQYLSHLRSAHHINPEELVEFIVVGAKLLFLKSCALLPQASAPAARRVRAESEREMTQMLLAYKQLKEATAALRRLEEQGQRTYRRTASPAVVLPPGLDGVTIDTLLRILQEALRREPAPEGPVLLARDELTVEDKVAALEAELERNKRLSFRAVMMACKSRTEVVIAFLAVLELIKAGSVWAEQEETFGDIILTGAPETNQVSQDQLETVERLSS